MLLSYAWIYQVIYQKCNATCGKQTQKKKETGCHSSELLAFMSTRWEYYLHVLLRKYKEIIPDVNNWILIWKKHCVAYSCICNTVLWTLQFHREIPHERICWDDEWWSWKNDGVDNYNVRNKIMHTMYRMKRKIQW